MEKALKTIAASLSLTVLLLSLGCGSATTATVTVTPSITQVTPQTIPAGSQTTTLRVKGANFTSAVVILWNGRPLITTVVDDNTLTGTIGSSSLATPSTASLQVQNEQTLASSQTLPILVSPSTTVGAPAALTITATSLPQAVSGTPFSVTFAATGGTAPYSWGLASGKIPPGLTLVPSSGLLTGTPTASGNYAFALSASDSSSSPQSATSNMTLTVASPAPTSPTSPVTPPLLITSSILPSGTNGTAYSAAMSANGGKPSYTWSITSGSLPSGLTLAATTGVISGTPTVTGTSAFTANVSDNSSPVQTKSASASIAVAAAASAPGGPGTTWYIRGDGGTRYSSNTPTGQCDGKADVGYSGSGTNQHCAFNDYRFLYDDQSWDNHAWVIAGGDTVIIRNGPYRIGYNQGSSASDTWCKGSDPYDCYNPIIPAGKATQPTRILGENYANCNQSNMTELYGGFGVWGAVNLRGAQFVTVECINLTRHSDCITFGSPALPSGCNTSYPLDDYALSGVLTDTNTHDLTLQDMWIHGFTSRGILGPIGGTVNATRLDIAYNGGAGWDFDDGQETPNKNGIINLSYVTVEWNGCNQAYPGGGVATCYSQSTGGYGDGIGTPAGTCLTAHVDHSTFRYNTQDGYDMLHNDTGNCSMSITDSTSYGNNGAQFKWGPNDNPMVFTNNTAVANCDRLSKPFPGAPSNYNANLQDFCRANDAIAIGFRDGNTTTMENNTIVTYAPVTFDLSCSGTYPDSPGQGTCNNSSFIFKNNIVMGYDNPSTYNLGGQPGGPAAIYYDEPIGHTIRSNNLFYGIGHSFDCSTGFPGESCGDPLFTGQPTFTGEASLDNFNFQLTSGSPAIGSGVFLPAVTLDYSGATRPNPPSIGALEP